MTLAAASFIAHCERGAAELDATTLQGCRAGDRLALGIFVTCYQHRVFAFLSRTLGSGPHIEDLAQEVFIRACRALPRFDVGGKASLSTWLFTIAYRIAVDARRKRRVPTTTLDAERAVARETPETERRRSEIRNALEHAVAALSDDQRDVFVLAEFHGLDMIEIASVLGVLENTCKTRLFRARERLRASLKGVWEDS